MIIIIIIIIIIIKIIIIKILRLENTGSGMRDYLRFQLFWHKISGSPEPAYLTRSNASNGLYINH